MNIERVAVALVLAAGLCSLPAGAQEQPGAWPRQFRRVAEAEQWSPLDQLERLRLMRPEQRERLLDRLPPDRRVKVERHLRNYMNLTPDQRARLREQYEMFRQLPVDKQ